MTKDERLAKNNRIREKYEQTLQKRKKQICRVYRVKVDISHLNAVQRVHLKMLFVEAKWLYNDALTFMNDSDINGYDTKSKTVNALDKDRQPITHELQYLASQMKQSVIQGIKFSLKSLASLKKKQSVGSLRYESDYKAINLQQFWVTYRFYDERVTVLPSKMPTTKYCPKCGNLKKDITLADRVYECPCGYIEDRDIHAARNMILLSKKSTCRTQGINAFGEDVRRKQKCCNADLVELRSLQIRKGR